MAVRVALQARNGDKKATQKAWRRLPDFVGHPQIEAEPLQNQSGRFLGCSKAIWDRLLMFQGRLPEAPGTEWNVAHGMDWNGMKSFVPLWRTILPNRNLGASQISPGDFQGLSNLLSGALGAASGTAMARLGSHGGILKAQLGTLGFILELPGIIFGALGDGFGRPRLPF